MRTLPELRQMREVEIGIFNDDVSAACRSRLSHGGGNDDTCSLRSSQLLAVLGMAQKAERVGRRALKRREPLDGYIVDTMEFTPKGVYDRSKRQ